nr:conotoxin precursor S [Conus judaeus]UMA83871.1 conotoxin precursor S [Conus judaeus]DAZ86863.1 TPA_inf: conotoxin precursor S [Conus judaeus]
MMSRMGAVFFLLMLFALASTHQEGDIEARKIGDWSYRSFFLSRAGGSCTCGRTNQCNGSCACKGPNCTCQRGAKRGTRCHCLCQD